MRINSKLDAFTLIEITVAMLLAAISILISYTAYSLITRSYREFDQKNKRIGELLLTDKMLKQDINSAQQILRSENGLSIETNQGEIKYTFTEQYIVRDQYSLHADTFFVANADFYTAFENKECLPGQLADQVSLTIHEGSKNIPFSYFKKYSSEELMITSNTSFNQ